MGPCNSRCGWCWHRSCTTCQRYYLFSEVAELNLFANPCDSTVLGAKVIAAAGSKDKIDIAKHYGGADHGVNYSKPGWQKEVLKLTGGKGVDVIYDPVGLINGMRSCTKKTSSDLLLIDCLKCIAWKGRALVIGFAAGTIEKVKYFGGSPTY